MPRTDGTPSDPGRERARDRKGDNGAVVMENRLEAQAGPTEVLFVAGVRVAAMIELTGSAKPRIPLKLGANGSVLTSVTAAVNIEDGLSPFSIKIQKWNTQSLMIDSIASDRD